MCVHTRTHTPTHREHTNIDLPDVRLDEEKNVEKLHFPFI